MFRSCTRPQTFCRVLLLPHNGEQGRERSSPGEPWPYVQEPHVSHEKRVERGTASRRRRPPSPARTESLATGLCTVCKRWLTPCSWRTIVFEMVWRKACMAVQWRSSWRRSASARRACGRSSWFRFVEWLQEFNQKARFGVMLPFLFMQGEVLRHLTHLFFVLRALVSLSLSVTGKKPSDAPTR